MSTALHRPSTPGLALRELMQGLPFEQNSGLQPDLVVTGVSLDSRSVVAGDLYAALPGFNRHGAEFADEAQRRGAVAVLTDAPGARRVPAGLPVIVTETPREVLGEVAARVYGRPSSHLTMVGITGTNGKTTVAYLIESALRAHGRRTGLIGTVETRLGDEVLKAERTTPEATDLHALLAVMLERGLDTCVMEVSSHALALHRVDGVHYDIALFTNLSQDHLDFHHDMADYYRAKASLFTPTRAGAAVIMVDDPWGARLAAETTVPVITVSTNGSTADWSVHQRHDDGDFTLVGPEAAQMRLRSHLPGTFNVANTALAALALLQVGLDVAAVEQAMAVPPDVPGRMQVVAAARPPAGSAQGAPRCIVDFAHSPDAVEAALLAVRPTTPGRLVVVLGAGGDRDRGKRHGMGAAAARHADVVVVTDDNPRSEDPAAIRGALLAGARSVLGPADDGSNRLIERAGRGCAIEAAVALAAPDGLDTVLVLGKGHEKGQEVAGVVHPFDDREAVLSALSVLSALPAFGAAREAASSSSPPSRVTSVSQPVSAPGSTQEQSR